MHLLWQESEEEEEVEEDPNKPRKLTKVESHRMDKKSATQQTGAVKSGSQHEIPVKKVSQSYSQMRLAEAQMEAERGPVRKKTQEELLRRSVRAGGPLPLQRTSTHSKQQLYVCVRGVGWGGERARGDRRGRGVMKKKSDGR
jgi:hypothetical protein